jgi:hypothetical protein
MSAEDHVSKMRKYFDLLFGKQMDELLALFSDDIDWFVVPTNTRIEGKGQFRAMAENHWAASPDRTKKSSICSLMMSSHVSNIQLAARSREKRTLLPRRSNQLAEDTICNVALFSTSTRTV